MACFPRLAACHTADDRAGSVDIAQIRLPAFLQSLGAQTEAARENDPGPAPRSSYCLEIIAAFCCDRGMKRLFPVICVFSGWSQPIRLPEVRPGALNPISGDWNTATNWSPSTVPNGRDDKATFDVSSTTAVALSTDTEVDSILFEPSASAFTVSVPSQLSLTISGQGLTNNSATIQNLVSGPNISDFKQATIQFTGDASAGNLTSITNESGGADHGGGYTTFSDNASAGSAMLINDGFTQFFDQSTAGSSTSIIGGGTFLFAGGGREQFYNTATAGDGTFILNGSTAVGAAGGLLEFFDNSTAGHGTFTVNGAGTSDGYPATLYFFDRASAGDGTFIVNDSAQLIFTAASTSTAGNATLIANGGPRGGGTISFPGLANTTGGTARIQLFGNGKLELTSRYSRNDLAIGSLEGDGKVLLGRHQLTVGTNNLSTSFSGAILDSRGSLIKVGTGTLTLSGSNTYASGTTIRSGGLKVNNETGSGTGTGPVGVLAGALGGSGIIAGPTTIGTGRGAGAYLQTGKGASNLSTLTIQSTLTFKSDGTYVCKLNTSKAKADKVVANEVTIDNGAQFEINAVDNKKLTVGKTFTAISNTSATPFAGTFANLAMARRSPSE